MEKEMFYTKLTDEQKKLYDYLEANGRRVYLFVQDGEMCAEVENWIEGGVDMIITLIPFSYDSLYEWWEGFDVDEEIDIHRQDKRYRSNFTIRNAVDYFEQWDRELEKLIDNFNKRV